jgi:hypothetical protein
MRLMLPPAKIDAISRAPQQPTLVHLHIRSHVGQRAAARPHPHQLRPSPTHDTTAQHAFRFHCGGWPKQGSACIFRSTASRGQRRAQRAFRFHCGAGQSRAVRISVPLRAVAKAGNCAHFGSTAGRGQGRKLRAFRFHCEPWPTQSTVCISVSLRARQCVHLGSAAGARQGRALRHFGFTAGAGQRRALQHCVHFGSNDDRRLAHGRAAVVRRSASDMMDEIGVQKC